jgi:DNA polymerase III delta prime subunit
MVPFEETSIEETESFNIYNSNWLANTESPESQMQKLIQLNALNLPNNINKLSKFGLYRLSTFTERYYLPRLLDSSCSNLIDAYLQKNFISNFVVWVNHSGNGGTYSIIHQLVAKNFDFIIFDANSHQNPLETLKRYNLKYKKLQQETENWKKFAIIIKNAQFLFSDPKNISVLNLDRDPVSISSKSSKQTILPDGTIVSESQTLCMTPLYFLVAPNPSFLPSTYEKYFVPQKNPNFSTLSNLNKFKIPVFENKEPSKMETLLPFCGYMFKKLNYNPDRDFLIEFINACAPNFWNCIQKIHNFVLDLEKDNPSSSIKKYIHNGESSVLKASITLPIKLFQKYQLENGFEILKSQTTQEQKNTNIFSILSHLINKTQKGALPFTSIFNMVSKFKENSSFDEISHYRPNSKIFYVWKAFLNFIVTLIDQEPNYTNQRSLSLIYNSISKWTHIQSFPQIDMFNPNCTKQYLPTAHLTHLYHTTEIIRLSSISPSFQTLKINLSATESNWIPEMMYNSSSNFFGPLGEILKYSTLVTSQNFQSRILYQLRIIKKIFSIIFEQQNPKNLQLQASNISYFGKYPFAKKILDQALIEKLEAVKSQVGSSIPVSQTLAPSKKGFTKNPSIPITPIPLNNDQFYAGIKEKISILFDCGIFSKDLEMMVDFIYYKNKSIHPEVTQFSVLPIALFREYLPKDFEYYTKLRNFYSEFESKIASHISNQAPSAFSKPHNPFKEEITSKQSSQIKVLLTGNTKSEIKGLFMKHVQNLSKQSRAFIEKISEPVKEGRKIHNLKIGLKTISEFIGQEEIKIYLNTLIEKEEELSKTTHFDSKTQYPCILLKGKYGTGKSTFAQIFARKLISKNKQSTHLLYFNGSDPSMNNSNGIKTIEDFIENGQSNPNELRIIIIDEFDHIGQSMSFPLKDMIPRNDIRCFFIACSNSPEQIPAELLSRFSKQFEFKTPTTPQLVAKLQQFCDFSPETCEEIVRVSKNQVRTTIIRALQLNPENSQLKPSDVLKMFPQTNYKQVVTKLLTLCCEYFKTDNLKKYLCAKEQNQILAEEIFDYPQFAYILGQFISRVSSNDDWKSNILKIISKAQSMRSNISGCKLLLRSIIQYLNINSSFCVCWAALSSKK